MKTKLTFIAILVISIMAVIITASQIYEIVSNEKIIDNDVNGIETEENEFQNKGENEFYNQTDPTDGLSFNYDPLGGYPPSFPWIVYGEEMTTVESDGTNIYNNTYRIQLGELSIKQTLANKIKDGTLNISSTLKTIYRYESGETSNSWDINIDMDNFHLVVNDNLHDSWSGFKKIIFIEGTVPSGPYVTTNWTQGISDYLKEQFNTMGYIFNYDFSKDEILLKIYFVNSIDVTVKRDNQNNPSYSSTNSFRIYNSSFSFKCSADSYEEEEIERKYGTAPYVSIESNELLQTNSTFNNTNLAQYIYEQLTSEWGEGKETATLKCSIGEYYNEDGTLAISTKQNDLPMLFDIGDLVIPYISVANGKTEPLSIKLDGTPKVFKVTQIRPYFDGAFWQEITLQEQTT